MLTGGDVVATLATGSARGIGEHQASFTFGMFTCRAALLGGCVQFQITNIERIDDRVIALGPLGVTIGRLKVSDQTQPGEERPTRWK
jgi:hypothetical protein